MKIRDLSNTLKNATNALLKEQAESGHWEGRLSDSALSTAVAVFALFYADPGKHHETIHLGLKWLKKNINDDGGWGDTPQSRSNISTTMLCYAAFSAGDDEYKSTVSKTEEWLKKEAGSLAPDVLAKAIESHYGKDKTFSAPILTMCTISGRLGLMNEAWGRISQLPFELAILPRRLYKSLNLSVVSYALPALIAVGLARFRALGDGNALTYLIRKAATGRALRILSEIQPRNGGFLEATPLTGFVVMSLVAAGLPKHRVAKRGTAFLTASIRKSGSWPIDTNLAVWTTTSAVNALPELEDKRKILRWLLKNQHSKANTFTSADPGGWGWTNLPGAVPDADDTAGALLALKKLDCNDISAVSNGIKWLLDLQNSDGGIPTFCKGWGKLPFDKSCADITAHAMRAMDTWYDDLPSPLQTRVNNAMHNAFCYLEKDQDRHGSWSPLWFGNQHVAGGENPVYGTALVIMALGCISPERLPRRDALLTSALRWLRWAQNSDGGWGGSKGVASSIEETALATRAMASAGENDVATTGTKWLIKTTKKGKSFPSAPIGLYFASLWYDERLYPIIFTIAALEEMQNS